MRYIDPQRDPWQHAVGEDGPKPNPDPAPHRLLSLEQWHAVRSHWPAAHPVAIEFPNDADIAQLAPDLAPDRPRIALIVLDFPVWTDGRAYSQARLLRRRFKFHGAIRARGAVLVDMLPLLHRTGFDEVQLRGDQSRAAAERALSFFAQGHYRGDVHEPRPAFAR